MNSDLLSRLRSDPVALIVLCMMVLWQLHLYVSLRRHTRKALKQGKADLGKAKETLTNCESIVDALENGSLPTEVSRGLKVVLSPSDVEQPLDLRYALAPARLLPGDYNERLDSAAPGIFTAVGIFGTFAGLLIAFFRLDFSDPAQSIAPLITGMSIAFLNSLLGVALSIRWTLRSRNARYAFEYAARELASKAEEKAETQCQDRYDSRLLRAIEGTMAAQEGATVQIVGELQALRSATSGASRELLESLAPKLEESFRALVNLPFERLTQSVDDFRDVVNTASQRSERTLAALDASIESVRQSQEGLEQVTLAAKASADAFAGGVDALQAGAEAAGAVVTEARNAAESLAGSSESFSELALRQETLAGSLDRAIVGLDAASAAMAGTAGQFGLGGDRLEAAAERIRLATIESVGSLLESIRKEVEAAVTEMSKSLTGFGDRTVAAYGESSERLIESLDLRVSDLTDRVSAELQTLAARLPESASEITRAADDLRRRLTKAVSGLQQAVKQLDVSSSQKLMARVEEYDRLVAKTVDHFSGTLGTWNGKVAELHEVGNAWGSAIADFQRESGATLKSTHTFVAAAASAADAAAKAALAVQSTVERLASIGSGAQKSPVVVPKVPNGIGAPDVQPREPA